MAEIVVEPNEIYLSSTRFPIRGGVRPYLVSTFPGKVVIGDYTKDSEQLMSNWIIADQTGGILIEEMDESVHADRCWWTNCEIGFRGHMASPSLATQVTTPTATNVDCYTCIPDGGLEIWTDVNTLTYWTKVGGGILTRDSTNENAGTYCAKLNDTVQGATYLYADIGAITATEYQSASITFKAQAKTTDAAMYCIGLDDGLTTTYSSDHTGGGTYEELSVTKAFSASATRLRLILYQATSAAPRTGYFDGKMTLTIPSVAVGSPTVYCDYNGNLYQAWGRILAKLNTSTGASFDFVACMPATITDLVVSESNYLYIFMGDSTSYIYMDTTPTFYNTGMGGKIDNVAGYGAGETTIHVDTLSVSTITKGTVLTISDVAGSYTVTANATVASNECDIVITPSLADSTADNADVAFFIGGQHGIHWDSKLFSMNTTGQISYSADPSSATPSWTNNGLLPLSSSACQGLFLYRDADQNEIIYASTKNGLWAHDYTNAKWLQTLVQLPEHSYAGKGFTNWHDSAYVSNGLEILKYVTGSTSTITSVGLNRDDGLPIEYQGEIVGLFGGHHYMYALIDSSLITGTGYSGLYQFDGMNWQCKWIGSTADDTMTCGTVSSVYAYRLYFDHDGKVYYILLSRTNANPLKATGSTYVTGGVWISPWFDGGTSVYDKLAKRARIFCKGTSSTVTVQLSYRIDHSTTTIGAVGTEWTSLGTIAAAGNGVETEYTFGTGAAGIVFKAIQFRLDFVTGSSASTADVQWLGLSFIKLLDTTWGWSITDVDCSQEYKGLSSAELDAALKTIIATSTLVDFTFRNESGGSFSYKVKVARASGVERTGNDWQNHYMLEIVAP